MIKKIVNFVFYLLSIFFLLSSMAMFSENNTATGVILLIIAIILLPILSNKILNDKNISFAKIIGIKVLSMIVLFIVSLSLMPNTEGDQEAVSDDGNKKEEKVCTSIRKASDDEDLDLNKLSCYTFSYPFVNILEELEIDDIESIYVDVALDDMYQFKIKTKTKILECTLFMDEENESWYVHEICDNDNEDIRYYREDNYVDANKEILRYDIYSYKTGKIVKKADNEKIAKYYNEQEQHEQERRENEISDIREQSEKDFVTIYNDFQNNELSAEEKHKGKIYTFVGTFEGANDDGLFNTILEEVTVSVKVQYNNKIYNLDCSFDKEWIDQLKGFNKGDEIFFKGECYSWGVWNDCEIVSF